MIKQILFDCGGVFTRLEFKEHMLRVSGREEIAEYFFNNVWAPGSPWHLYDKGELGDGEIAGELKKFMPTEIHPYLEKFVENWLDALPRRDGMEPMMDALQERGYPCYLLSNFPKCFVKMPERVPLLKRMDKIVLSSDIHMLKPDPAIFIRTAEILNIRPEETLFVDDSAANVKSAESVGYQAYLFTEPELFLDYLKQNNIIGE